MNVIIGKYLIKGDVRSYTLLKQVKKKDKETGKKKIIEKVIGYYTQIETVLKRIVENSIQTSDAETIAEVLHILKETKELIVKHLRIPDIVGKEKLLDDIHNKKAEISKARKIKRKEITSEKLSKKKRVRKK